MKEIKQLNKAEEWGGGPREKHRFYSVLGLCPTLQTFAGGGACAESVDYERENR